MPTLTDIQNEVQTIFHDMQTRVSDLDKEQKKLREDLTSKSGEMPAEAKSSFDAMNGRINELMDKLEQAQIASKRPPLGDSGKKDSPARQAFLKALRRKGDLQFLSHEEKAMIVPELMPAEMKALYAGDATTGGFFASTDFVQE